jgi:hypothetical protein
MDSYTKSIILDDVVRLQVDNVVTVFYGYVCVTWSCDFVNECDLVLRLRDVKGAYMERHDNATWIDSHWLRHRLSNGFVCAVSRR